MKRVFSVIPALLLCVLLSSCIFSGYEIDEHERYIFRGYNCEASGLDEAFSGDGSTCTVKLYNYQSSAKILIPNNGTDSVLSFRITLLNSESAFRVATYIYSDKTSPKYYPQSPALLGSTSSSGSYSFNLSSDTEGVELYLGPIPGTGLIPQTFQISDIHLSDSF